MLLLTTTFGLFCASWKAYKRTNICTEVPWKIMPCVQTNLYFYSGTPVTRAFVPAQEHTLSKLIYFALTHIFRA